MPDPQPAVFRRLRVRLVRNGLRSLLAAGRTRLVTLVFTSLFVAGFVFGVSLFGFLELFRLDVPVKGLIVAGLFDLLFLTLGVMLLVSTGIVLYASLYTSPEARFLLTTPARADRIFATKFQAAVGYSSWGFVVLGLPVLIAYGVVAGVPWYFVPLLPLFLLGFVLVPGAISSLACLLFVRYAPRNRKQAGIAVTLVLSVVIGFWCLRIATAARETIASHTSRDALDGFVGQIAFAQNALTPSHWMTTGLLAAARGEPRGILLPLGLLWSNGLLAYLAAAWTSTRLYRTGYDRLSGAGRGRAVYRGNILDTFMERLVFYLDKPTRVLVVKDFRTFRRDPTQWVLLAIFGIMLLVGAGNFRGYSTADLDTLDKYIVGLVNLGGIAVLLCAGLSRFIFPLISLEGRKFWILGLVPLRRRQILIGKFAFAATGSVLIAEALVLGSETLLGLSLGGLFVHGATIAVIAIGLSGLNVGLGASMPNFRETDPSKIVVGFSGTMNMVAGLCYLVVQMAVMAGPLHGAAVLKHFHKDVAVGFPWWAYAGLPPGLFLGMLAVWLPLRAGTRALDKTEF